MFLKDRVRDIGNQLMKKHDMFAQLDRGLKSRNKLTKILTKNENFKPMTFQIKEFIFEAYKFDIPISPFCVYNEWPTSFEKLNVMAKMLNEKTTPFEINSADLKMFKDVPSPCTGLQPAILGFLTVLSIAA